MELLQLDRKDAPTLELRERRLMSFSMDQDCRYSIEIDGRHFSAARDLTLNDLRDIRDWCNVALREAALSVAAE